MLVIPPSLHAIRNLMLLAVMTYLGFDREGIDIIIIIKIIIKKETHREKERKKKKKRKKKSVTLEPLWLDLEQLETIDVRRLLRKIE